MSDIKNLHAAALKCLQRYPLAAMLFAGYSIDDINSKMLEHRDRLLACDSYETAFVEAGEAVNKVTYMKTDLNLIITTEADRRELYRIFCEWRRQVLKA